MLRHGGLRDGEFGGDHLDDLARRALPVGEQLQYAAADRIAQDVEGVAHSGAAAPV